MQAVLCDLANADAGMTWGLFSRKPKPTARDGTGELFMWCAESGIRAELLLIGLIQQN